MWECFVALPQRNVLLFATDKTFLSSVLERMQHRAEKRALPEELPEWKYVDFGAQVWAVRHYDVHNGPLDPTSPLYAAEWHNREERDDQAVGLIFAFDPSRPKVAKVIYLSSNYENARRIAEISWKLSLRGVGSKPHVIARIQKNKPGVMQITVLRPLAAEANGIFLLRMLMALGHGFAL